MNRGRQCDCVFNLTHQGYLLRALVQSLPAFAFLSSLSFLSYFSFFSPLPFRRLVKRALPSPVPIVSTPQCATSCMNGTSLNPCTTASLCISTVVRCSPILGIASNSSAGRLNLLLSQLPGRFCAPRSMVPSR